MMDRKRLEALLGRLPGLHIAVVGDLFLDRYWLIDPALDEPSLETGRTAWQVVDTQLSPGAAGTVLNNLAALGIGTLHCVSLLGRDGEGEELRALLGAQGVDLRHTAVSAGVVTPFYTKPMFRQADGSWQEGNRIDRKNLARTPEDIEARLLEAVDELSREVDALILLDQLIDENTGVVTANVRDAAAALAREKPGLIVFADSRAFIDRFRDMSIKCNDKEALAIAGLHEEDDFDADQVGRALSYMQAGRERPSFITCNRHGIAVMEAGQLRLTPAVRQPGPIDVVGAGDASTAGIVSALCAGASPAEAAQFANLCAGVTIRKLGTTGTASPAEILALFDEQQAGLP